MKTTGQIYKVTYINKETLKFKILLNIKSAYTKEATGPFNIPTEQMIHEDPINYSYRCVYY